MTLNPSYVTVLTLWESVTKTRFHIMYEMVTLIHNIIRPGYIVGTLFVSVAFTEF